MFWLIFYTICFVLIRFKHRLGGFSPHRPRNESQQGQAMWQLVKVAFPHDWHHVLPLSDLSWRSKSHPSIAQSRFKRTTSGMYLNSPPLSVSIGARRSLRTTCLSLALLATICTDNKSFRVRLRHCRSGWETAAWEADCWYCCWLPGQGSALTATVNREQVIRKQDDSAVCYLLVVVLLVFFFGFKPQVYV